jgi:hypothetical protein
MKTWVARALCVALWLLASGSLMAEEAPVSAEPNAAPRTRPEMKNALEQLKHRKSRLNLPPPPPGEESANNGRARKHFLPAEWQTPSSQTPVGPNGQRGPSDPAMTLDNVFTVQMFWISARLNNCHY